MTTPPRERWTFRIEVLPGDTPEPPSAFAGP